MMIINRKRTLSIGFLVVILIVYYSPYFVESVAVNIRLKRGGGDDDDFKLNVGALRKNIENEALSVVGGSTSGPSPPHCPKPYCECTYKLFEGLKVNCTNLSNSSGLLDTVFSQLPLETVKLQLIGGQITYLPSDALRNLTQLRFLYLKNNSIWELKEVLSTLPLVIKRNLTHLDVSKNKLEVLFANMSYGFDSLHTLNLDENKLNELSENHFDGFKRLESLYLGGNVLKRLRNGTFYDCSHLRHLYLYRNHISEIESGSFNGLIKLETLHLEGNRISEIIPGTLKSLNTLSTLFLRENLLEKLSLSLLESPRISKLYLSYNRITNIDPDVIDFDGKFKYLYLNNNRLRMLNATFLSKLDSSVHTGFANNPWNCDCQILPFVKWLRRFKTSKEDEHLKVSCDSPIELRGKLIKPLPWQLFKCDPDDVHLFSAIVCDDSSSLNREQCSVLRNRICSSDRKNSSCLCRGGHSSPCYVCPSGSYGHNGTKCLPCPPLTSGGIGAEKLADCQCAEGFESVSRTQTGSVPSCNECPVNFFKSVIGAESCKKCSFGSKSLYTASESCDCLPGFYSETTGICNECPPNYFKNWTGSAKCMSCPPHYVSLKGSTSLDNCTCPYNMTTPCQPQHHLKAENQSEKNSEEEEDEEAWFIILIAVGISLLTVTIGLVLVYRCAITNKNKSHKVIKLKMDSILQNMNPIHATDNSYICNETWSELMVDLSQVQFEQILGQGAFGQVHKAVVTGLKNTTEPTTVAIKRLRDGHSMEEKDALYTELQQLIYVGQHPNIINLLGFINTEETIMLVIEFANYGDLLSYLRNKKINTEYADLQFSQSSATYESPAMMMMSSSSNGRSRIGYRDDSFPTVTTTDSEVTTTTTSDDNTTIDVFTLLSIAWQVAKGMNHLAHMKCIHRDLAARNILLSCGKVAKVSDFGLARAVYESGYYFKETKGRLPFKWMPPEAIIEGQYTTKSDVWSFGILLWELFTLGGNPYPGVPMNSLLDLLQSGYRMAKPNNCSNEVFEIMHQCWRERASDRPSFQQLTDSLDAIIQRTANMDYIELDKEDTREEDEEVEDGETRLVVLPSDSDNLSLCDFLSENSTLLTTVSSNGTILNGTLPNGPVPNGSSSSNLSTNGFQYTRLCQNTGVTLTPSEFLSEYG